MKDLVSISKDNEIAELREKVAKLESSLRELRGGMKTEWRRSEYSTPYGHSDMDERLVGIDY